MHRLFVVGFIALFVAGLFSIFLFLVRDTDGVETEVTQIREEAETALETVDASDEALQALIATTPSPDLGISITLPEVRLPAPPRIRSVNDPGGFFGINSDIARANQDAERQWQQAQEQLDRNLREAELRLERQINAAESRLRMEINASQQQVTGLFSAINDVHRTLRDLFDRLANIRLPDGQSFILIWLPIAISICSAL